MPSANRTYRIAVIPGDNVGKEVIPESLKALRALSSCSDLSFKFTYFSYGADHYLQHGAVMAADGLERLQTFDAILLGALGDPARVPDNVISWGFMQQLRKQFDLYVNLRPFRLLPAVQSPLADLREFDVVIVRENTEGEYAGLGGRLHAGQPQEMAVQTSVFTRHTTARLMRFAFELARQRKRLNKVTAVTKSNAMKYSMVFWDEIFRETAAAYPDVETEIYHVDAMSMYLIQRPKTFDVIVASNLFGDILSDEAAAIHGGIGLAASGNLNPEGEFPSMFEPIHGSAPDIAGQTRANPLAAILAARLMLQHFGEQEAASLLLAAVEAVLNSDVRTADLGGSATTGEVGDAVAEAISRQSAPSIAS